MLFDIQREEPQNMEDEMIKIVPGMTTGLMLL